MDFIIVVMLAIVILLLMVLIIQSGGLFRRFERQGHFFEQNVSEIVSLYREQMQSFQSGLQEELRQGRADLDRRLLSLGEQGERRNAALGEIIDRNDNLLLRRMEERIQNSSYENAQRVYEVVERKIHLFQESTDKRLEEIRVLVEKELQSILGTRLSESFGAVAASLENVQRGLGEMQGLAKDASDLKQVFLNVKNRGNFGEVFLGRILEDVLTPSQYVENIEIEPGKRVEFAVKLPGKESGDVLLPIDSKFPLESYRRLMDASTKEEIESARKELYKAVKVFAKQIEAYVKPPRTTNFALMFVPTEGLYAEIVRNADLFEELRRNHGIIVVGASTISALLSSLQVGFKTLAIERRSEEVWAVLSKVKHEFHMFSAVLEKARTQLNQADRTLDLIASTKMNQVRRALERVEEESVHEAVKGD